MIFEYYESEDDYPFKFKIKYYSYMESFEYIDILKQWCLKTFGGGMVSWKWQILTEIEKVHFTNNNSDWPLDFPINHYIFQFKNKNDAVLFKITHGGS